jgi:hypothetical protein
MYKISFGKSYQPNFNKTISVPFQKQINDSFSIVATNQNDSMITTNPSDLVSKQQSKSIITAAHD